MTSELGSYDPGPMLGNYQGPLYRHETKEFRLYGDRVLIISRGRGWESQQVAILNQFDSQPLWSIGHRGYWLDGIKKGFWPGLFGAAVPNFFFHSHWIILIGVAFFLVIALPEFLGNLRPIRWVSFKPFKDAPVFWVMEDPQRKQEFEAFVSAVSEQIQIRALPQTNSNE